METSVGRQREDLLAAARALVAELGRPASQRELASRLGWSQAQVGQVIRRARHNGVFDVMRLTNTPDDWASRMPRREQRIPKGKRPHLSRRVVEGLARILVEARKSDDTLEARAYLAALVAWHERRHSAPHRPRRQLGTGSAA